MTGNHLGIAEANGDAAAVVHDKLRVDLDAVGGHIEVAALFLSAKGEHCLAHQVLRSLIPLPDIPVPSDMACIRLPEKRKT